MRKSIFTAVFASALAWPVACSSPTDDCSGVGRDGLALFVTDSASGANLNHLATITVTQLTAPFESRSGPIAGSPSPLGLAADRPGPYQLSVSVIGYESWEKDVTVAQTGGRCPETVTLTVTAKLVRPA